MKQVLAAGLVLALGGTGIRAADAKCAMTELVPHLLTPTAAKLPADGGILVGWEADVAHDRSNTTPLAPAWKLSDGNGTIEATTTTIAPGVVVYRAKAAGKTPLVLTDAAGKTNLGTFTRDGTDKNDLAAPSAGHAQLVASKAFRGTFHSFSVDVAAVPDAAVGVILYDAKQVAISFETVSHDKTGATTVQPYLDAGRCTSNPDGMHAPAAGDRVTIAWVDRYGRIGKPSAAFTVAAVASSNGKPIEDD